MTSSIEPERSADEIAISSVDDEIWNIKTRMREDPGYGSDLGHALLKLLSEIWPPSTADPDTSVYVATISSGIDKIPAEILDELSEKLVLGTTSVTVADPVARDAFSLLAGWLRARSIELVGDASFRMAARQLKMDHSLLLGRLLSQKNR